MTQRPSQRPDPPVGNDRATTMRVVGFCAIVGTLIHIASGALHGALTAGTDQSSSAAIYEHVQATPGWAAVNLAMLLAILAWLAVFVGIDLSGPREPTWRIWLGRLAALVLAVGVAAATLLFLVDAIVVPALAEQWAAADAARQSELVALGDAVQTAIRTPLFHVLPMFVYGLPFALLGAAHSRNNLLPAWLGWLALIAGAASFAMGSSRALGSTAIPEILLWTVIQPLIWIWGIGTGITFRRRSTTMPVNAQRR